VGCIDLHEALYVGRLSPGPEWLAILTVNTPIHRDTIREIQLRRPEQIMTTNYRRVGHVRDLQSRPSNAGPQYIESLVVLFPHRMRKM
jgi:hypothetical protein